MDDTQNPTEGGEQTTPGTPTEEGDTGEATTS
jgi:hypothetical protein